jgi:hypothetical protein
VIFIKLTEHPRKQFTYLVSGETLIVDKPVSELVHLAAGPDMKIGERAFPAVHIAAEGRVVYDEPGWVANAWRHVTCTANQDGYRLQVEGVGRFALTADGQNIICEEDAAPPGSRLLAETLLGAPLILALAMKGIWSLHAGAIIEENRLILFVGESRRGKSTLARSLAEDPQRSRVRAVDDVLPVSLRQGGLVGLPHFPQLKISAAEQLAPTIPGSLPIEGIYVLEDALPDEAVAADQLNERDALLALVKHTVASRLFDSPTLARHLAFCAEAARRVPISRLVYPHRQGAVAEVAAQIGRGRQH